MSDFLSRIAAADRPNYGYARTPSLAEPRKLASASLSEILAADRRRDAVLWPALFATWPSWHWGLQGTGDCVSWGTAHALDCNLAVLANAQKIRRPDALVCQESIYGFGKCELKRSYGYHDAGMSGRDAIRAVRRFGTLYRRVYGQFDLREYSGERAEAWGEMPEETHGVPDALEPMAAEHRSADEVQVDDVIVGGALLQAGYAWQWCGYTSWGVARNDDGIAVRFASGWHCVTATGVRYRNGLPYAFWIANTGHGNHVRGPVGPIAMPEVYAQCGSWVPAHYVQQVLDTGDCWTTTFVEGWPVLDLSDFGFFAKVLG